MIERKKQHDETRILPHPDSCPPEWRSHPQVYEVFAAKKEDMTQEEKQRLVNALSKEIVKIIDRIVDSQFQEQDKKDREIRKEK